MIKQMSEFFSADNVFFKYILAIIGIYLAQTAFKISKCRKDGTFSWKELLNGMFDYAIYFIGIIIFFFAGSFLPADKTTITFGGKNYNIPDALTMLMWALIVLQSAKCFKNIQETFNIKDEDIKSTNHLNDYDVDKFYGG